jgi:hypothetical protein
MPTLEKGSYLIHYKDYATSYDITSVEIFAEGESPKHGKESLWVWADSLPSEVRDYVYEEATKILERSL